ncbi:hypothetical conserved protein (plasmid) [Geobacillus kaustophilus HTA426]|uniref:Hypothetical conserved protein n=1 Tax=Geobacillus kaustophilus (strain HTA426) TaxID=235909 RepID=Q5QL44_GEOKA|nr:XdhC family protein [Geobacillus kaustophilus]BAD74266.1 hypothetical conserved protein [Geobacillus kaustophilus HTA426]
MLDILNFMEECWKQKKSAALATIVHVEGSSYRREGARAIVSLEGKIIGSISGGCVESDLQERAARVLTSGQPEIVRYDFRGDNDSIWGMGVGCNGAVTVFIEPLDPRNDPENMKRIMDDFRKLRDGNESVFLLQVIESEDHKHLKPGTRLRYLPKGISVQSLLYEFKLKGKESGLIRLLYFDSNVMDREIPCTLYVEQMKPIPRLVIFGAGPDVAPLVKLAKSLQWLVTVIDHRPAYANKSNFPEADRIILVPRGKFPDNLCFDQETYAVVMSHHFEQDQLYLNELLKKPIPYIGMLGPLKRTAKLLNISESDVSKIERLHGPVGLDLGGETPEEIALAILAEIIAVRQKGSCRPLKQKKGPIHRK